ncbi:MAG: glycoside hydrolase family 127 protein [Clostridia bacterium]|nr:glycoside hydrolase family 127 protein [Clostridia bacterium]
MKKWNMFTTNEIKPKGWLYKQLRIQAKGLSGNLDKVWPDIRDSSWIGGTKDGWERVPYWLDGFIPLAYFLEDKDMIARAKKYIDAIVSKQNDDGWLCPCSKENRANYDAWAVFLMTKVLTVYYECSKDEKIPDVIYRTLKNYYELISTEQIKLFGWAEYRWFEFFIAINFTYERCKEDWLKDLAKIIKKQGSDYEACAVYWDTPRNEWAFYTHIVNIAMMLKYEAVSCELLDTEYKDIAEKLRGVLKQYNGTVVEIFTGDECLSGISPIQGTELCAVVEQMYAYELLFAYTGDSKWAERLEILAFNALPATISDDMWTHQYVQMNNQIACQKFIDTKPIFRTNGPESHLFGLEPNFGCCTANFNQGWPKFALSSFMYNDEGVINVVPVPCQLKTSDFDITLDTNYPFDNTLKYTIDSNKDFKFEIRIPADAENIIINEKKASADELIFNIVAGDRREITVSFNLKPHFEDYSYNLKYVKCGNLVFSLPIKFEKIMHEYVRNDVERKFPYCDYELVPQSDWNYAFADASLTVESKTPGEVPFSADEPPITVTAKMKKIDWGFEEGYTTVCAKTPKSLEAVSCKEDIKLVPYGAAKLRMTVMPLI